MTKKRLTVFVSLLLAAVMALTSCGGGKSSISELLSETPESGAAESSSAEPVSDVSEPSGEQRYSTVVSTGKKYTKSSDPASSYPDNYGLELTDGQYVNSEFADYSDEKWCGFSGDSSFIFVMDMGDDSEKLYGFGVSAFCDPGTGIGFPTIAVVYSSDDGENYEKLGTAKRLGNASGKYCDRLWLELDEPISAKYIKFTVARGNGWLFIDELIVTADKKGNAELDRLAGKTEQAYLSSDRNAAAYVAAVEAAATSVPDRTLRRTNISTGKAYTSSVNYSPDFTKSLFALTDGYTVGAGFESGHYVGYSAADGVSFTLDLDSAQTDIADLEVSFYSSPSLGAQFPAYVDFLISGDGKTFSQVGRIYAPTSQQLSVFTYSLKLNRAVKAEYIRFALPADGDTKFYLAEETAAFAYRENYDGGYSYYDTSPLKKADGDIYFDNGSSTIRNMLFGAALRVFMGYGTEKKFAGMNTPETSGIMTDGAFASSETDIDSMFRFYEGKTRDVVYDIGALCSLERIEVSLAHGSLLRIPESYSFYLSENGTDWYRVESVDGTDAPAKHGMYKLTADLGGAYKARFIRLEFAFSSQVGIDEITAYGCEIVGDGTTSLSSGNWGGTVKFGDVGYRDASADTLGGAGDTVLLYYYDYNKSQTDPLDGYTYDEILPYAAYLDGDGNILDTMFDGFLYMSSGTLKNGGSATGGADLESAVLAAKQAFADGTNLAALDKAVGDVKAKLRLGEYKAVYYLTICVPTKGTLYGDLDGDGVADKLVTDEDCLKAVNMQTAAYAKLVSEHSYDNIVCGGFYYFDESIQDPASDKYIINNAVEYAGSLGYQIFWIPFNNATGYTEWANYGFDCVCLQPGYAFSDDAKSGRIDYAANLAARLNMCIEIEISNSALYDESYLNRYMAYMYNGIYYGYMSDAIHMYFQSYSAFASACNSDTPTARLIYDVTYGFIKNTLTANPEKRSDLTFDTDGGAPYIGSLGDSDSGLTLYTACTQPSHGTVTVCPDGSFTYYPDADYAGEDSFTYTYSYRLGESAPCVARIS